MDKEKDKTDPAGHRQRLKEQFLRDKVSLSDLKLLELLLHYSIPRRDTVQTAKNALEKFGSIEALLGASWEDILEIPGFGVNSAVLIQLIQLLKGKTLINKRSHKFIKNTSDAVKYINTLQFDWAIESFYIIGLNEEYEVIDQKLLSSGSPVSTSFSLKDILKFALTDEISYVILTHNHNGNCVKPSKEDIDLTNLCTSYLNDLEVNLIDHIIIGNNKYFSFAVHKLNDLQASEYARE